MEEVGGSSPPGPTSLLLMRKKLFFIGGFLLFFCSLILFSSLQLIAIHAEAESLQDASSHYYRGKELDRQGKPDEAMAELKKALEIDPNFGKAHLMLGVTYTDKGLTDDAIAEYKKAIDLGMDSMNMAIAHYNLGIVYLRKGMGSEAEAEFAKSRQANPNFQHPQKALVSVARFMHAIPKGWLSENAGQLFFFLLVLSVVILTTFFRFRGLRRALMKLSSGLPGKLTNFLPSYTGDYQGLKFNILIISGGRNSPPFLKVSLIKKATFKLSVYKESALSELGKKIGVVREVKVFDEAFDKEFLIFSNKPDRATSYFSNSEIKNAARELLGLGFSSLIINAQGLTIQKTNYNLNIDIEPQRMISVIQKLSILARGCN